jgi:hypothetical protein
MRWENTMSKRGSGLFGIAVAALVMAASGGASAATATFNFEGLTATGNTGGYTSITVSDNGLGATFTRGGAQFDLRDISSFGAPTGFGAATLSPFFNTTTGAFLLSFSLAVTSLTFQAGDFFGDADILTATAFENADGTGAEVDSVSLNYPSTFGLSAGNILNPVLSGTFRSVVFIGGSTGFPHSLYYDNFVAEFTPVVAVPAPGGALLFAFGLLGLGVLTRRQALARRA